MDLLFAAWKAAPDAATKRRAEGRLLAAARPVLLRAAASVVGEQGAEDAAQDALVRLVSYGLAQFRGEGPLVAYLSKIARNCALNALRKDHGYSGAGKGRIQNNAHVFNTEAADWGEIPLEFTDPEVENAEEQLLRAEDQGRLLVALEILQRRRPRWGRLLREHYLEGRTFEQIGERDHLTHGTDTSNVRVVLHRARRCLAGILKEIEEKENV